MIAPGRTATRQWRAGPGTQYEYSAFVPAPIDTRIPSRWGEALVDAVARTASALQALPGEDTMAGLAVHLGRAEAGGSSMIEGHFVQARRLFEMQLEPDVSTDTKAIPVFKNWEMLTRARAADRISVDELLAWHRLLMEHDPRSHPGEFRQVQNWIGGDGWGPRRATYVPPPPDHVAELLEDLVGYANGSLDHPIIKAAVLHVQFESIHPFVDGNGRVGRALIHWALRNSQPSVPPLALVWYAHGDRYFQMLDSWRKGPEPEPFVAYFVESLDDATASAHSLLRRLDDLRSTWAEIATGRAGSLKRNMVADLATNPIVDAELAGERFGADPSRFSRVARELASLGVLTETKVPRRRPGRPRTVYEARQVFEVLNEFVGAFRAGEIPA